MPISNSRITEAYNIIPVGRALNVQHFRRNTVCGAMEELPPIDSNPSYDFDFQVNSQI